MVRCPICESDRVVDFQCQRCYYHFWKDKRGLWTAGNITEMHQALLTGNCQPVKEMGTYE